MARYRVMVIVSVAVWLVAPVPLAAAVTETVLVPTGVPGFVVVVVVFVLPPHDVSPNVIRTTNRPKRQKLRSIFLR